MVVSTPPFSRVRCRVMRVSASESSIRALHLCSRMECSSLCCLKLCRRNTADGLTALGCSAACGIPSDFDFALEPIFEGAAVLVPPRFVQLVGAPTNLLFQFYFCC